MSGWLGGEAQEKVCIHCCYLHYAICVHVYIYIQYHASMCVFIAEYLM